MQCVRFRDVKCPWYNEPNEVDEFECEDCPVMQEFREWREMQERCERCGTSYGGAGRACTRPWSG